MLSKPPYIERSSSDYRRANLALFIAGFITFSTLYDVQPLLPMLSAEFAVSPMVGSLVLSVSTFALAWSLPVSGGLSDALGRRVMMATAVVLTSLLALATATCDSLYWLIVLRLVQGVVLAGVPAVAMAYLSEEMSPRAVSTAMGLYIAGNAMGGMSGRMLTTWVADLTTWRTAIGAIGALNLILSLVFLATLPRSRHFQRQPLRLRSLTASLLGHLRNPKLCCLFAVAFLSMGSFVTLYNYVTFRLTEPPYSVNPSHVAWIFLSYAFGAFASTLIGRMVDCIGRSKTIYFALSVMVAGVMLTLLQPLVAIAAGVVIFTIGFFGVHAIASAWIGTEAKNARAQASSLYLFFYYLGSSLSGTGGGMFWSHWGWVGVVALILLLLLTASLAILRLVSLTATSTSAPQSPGFTALEESSQ